MTNTKIVAYIFLFSLKKCLVVGYLITKNNKTIYFVIGMKIMKFTIKHFRKLANFSRHKFCKIKTQNPPTKRRKISNTRENHEKDDNENSIELYSNLICKIPIIKTFNEGLKMLTMKDH